MTGQSPSRAAAHPASRIVALTAPLLLGHGLGCSRHEPPPSESSTEVAPQTETHGREEDSAFPGRTVMDGPSVEGARQPTVGGGDGWRYVAWMTPDALGERASVHVAARSEEDERWRDPTVLTASASLDHPLRLHDARPRRLAVTWSAAAGQALRTSFPMNRLPWSGYRRSSRT